MRNKLQTVQFELRASYYVRVGFNDEFSKRPIGGVGIPLDARGAGVFMQQIYKVWNRNYKAKYFVAPNIDDALAMALMSDHIRRPRTYRKFEDITDQALNDEAATTVSKETLRQCLMGEKSGWASQGDDGVWTVHETSSVGKMRGRHKRI